MNARLLFTIATVSCLMGVYAVYAVATRPFVVIPDLPERSNDPTEHAAAHRPLENVRVAQEHLPEQSWAAESQYMMRSGQSFIFTQSLEPVPSDGRVRVRPFAMVWVQKEKDGREKAVTIVSDSALVRFAAGFEGSNPNPGRVIGAVLDGEVQLKGPDGLAIGGKQFIFDESAPSLISTNPVKFKYGSHNGWGASLNVKLIPAEGPPGRDRPHVFGIRTVRLGSGINPATERFEPVQLDFRVPQQGETKLVKVRCSGDLEYDVAQQTALFSKLVRAHSKGSGSHYDGLDCDKLWIQFAAAPKDVPATLPTDDPDKKPSFQQVETDLVFSRMIAEGQPVKIVSTEQNLRATMKRLVYDADQRRLQLLDPRNVEVEQRGAKLAVPEVDVRMREDNWPDDVLCRGQGRLEMTRPDTTETAFVATWAGQLRLAKSAPAAAGLDLIQLEKQASFLQPKQKTGLAAELIQLWLAEPMNKPAEGGNALAGSPGKKSPEPRPKRLVAERDVALISPQLKAKTAELDVMFESPPSNRVSQLSRDHLELVGLEVPARPTNRPRGPGNAIPTQKPLKLRPNPIQPINHSTMPHSRDSLGPPIEIPMTSGSENTGRDKSVDLKSNGQDPLDMVADRIAVLMRRVEGKTDPELVDVDTQGHVKVTQRHSSGEAPLTAEGDRLRLQNRGLLREVVHLFGQPAHLRDRGLHVEGREVHMDREANRVWVKGNGLLQLPVPPGTEIESIGEIANDPDMDVWWDESMEFDGRTAKFIGKVRAELGRSRMLCEQMDVSFDSRLSFSDTKLNKQPELATIECREDVTFNSSAYEGNKLIRAQRGKVAEFTIDRINSSTFAQGPGEIQVWQRAEEGANHREGSQANRSTNSVVTDWNFTRITFKGRMKGKIHDQSSTFFDSVQVVHGPVERPNEKIDVDHLTAKAGSMRCDQLEFSFHNKDATHAKDYVQLAGSGNTRIEGYGFYANAQEISYDGAKGLYMLRSYGNESATIALDSKGKRHEASGRRIEFIRETQTIKVDWATGATGSP